jgi:hypothetical protein
MSTRGLHGFAMPSIAWLKDGQVLALPNANLPIFQESPR